MLPSRFAVSVSMVVLCCGPSAVRAADPPDRDALRLGGPRFRHPAEVRFLAAAPDGAVLAASADGAIRLYDEVGRDIRTLDRDNASITALLATPPHPHLGVVVGERDGSVRLLARPGNAPNVTCVVPRTGAVTCLAFSRALDLLVVGDTGGYVLPMPVGDLRREPTAQAPVVRTEGPVLGLAFGADRDRRASLLVRDRTSLRLLRMPAGEEVARCALPSGPAGAVLFTEDNRTVLAAGANGWLFVLDAADLRLRSWRRAHDGGVLALALSADRRLLASAGADGTVRVWDAQTVTLLRECEHDGAPITALAFLSDGQTLIGAAGTVLRRWDAATGRDRTVAFGHCDTVTAVAYLDSRTVASAGDGGVRVWNLDRAAEVRRFFVPGRPLTILAGASDGTTLAGADGSGNILLLDVSSGASWSVADRGRAAVRALAFAPDGRRLLIGDDRGELRVVDRTGRLLLRLGAGASVHGVAWTPDGNTLLARHIDGSVTRWNAADGSPLPLAPALRQTLDAPVRAATTDASLALAAGPERLRLVRLDGGRVVAEWPTPEFMLPRALSADGRSFVGLGSDGAVLIWETATGQLRCRLPPEPRRARTRPSDTTALALAPDGRSLTLGCRDGTIVVWPLLRRWRTAEGVWGLWPALVGTDPDLAYRAGGELSSDPDNAVHWVRRYLEVEGVPVRRLVTDLGAEEFRTRYAATRDLIMLGSGALPELQRAIENVEDLETRKRLLDLAEHLNQARAPPRVRALRMIEVLERIGTPAARDALEPFTRDGNEDVRLAALDARNRLAGKR
jgi:WD40 repeat protein